MIGAIPGGAGVGRRAREAGPGARARRRRLQDRRGAVPHVGARHLRGGGHAVCRVAVGRARRPPASSSSSGCISRAPAAPALLWVPVVSAMAGLTIVAGNLMAIPQQNVKRLLAYSGIAHIGYMLMGIAAMSADGAGMVLFYLVAYLFGNMGAFLVVQAVGGGGGIRPDGRLPRPGAALAGAGAEHARVPAVARRDSVRGGLLGEALHLPGGRSISTCTGSRCSARC